MKNYSPIVQFKSILVLTLLSLSISSFAQPYWEFHDLPSGVDGDDVSDLLAVGNGEFWLATNQGLFFYDNGSVTSYTSSNSNLPSDQVRVLEWINGTLWIGTLNGLASFDGTSFSVFDNSNGLISNSVRDLAVDQNGELWIGTPSGLSHYDGSTFNNDNTYPAHSLAFDGSGNLWILRFPGVLSPFTSDVKVFDGSNWNDVMNSDIHSFFINLPRLYGSPNGDIYLYSADQGYFAYDGTNWQQFDSDAGFSGITVNDMAVDASGNVWTANQPSDGFVGGLRRKVGNSFEVHSLNYQGPKASCISTFGDKIYAATSQGIAHANTTIKAFNYFETLDLNNIHAGFNANGTLFNSYSDLSSPRFEMNPGDSTHGIFFGQLWITTKDGADVQASGGVYTTDFITGSITDEFTVYRDPILKISRQEIEDHQANYNQQGYVMPEAIANWPANGAESLGEAQDLAPFFDVNNNGCYDPENGDYPYIKGDQAIYFIYNDQLSGQDGTGGTPIGLEIHVMAYAYDHPSIPELDNTIFMHYSLINRSAVDYDSVKAGLLLNFNLGGNVDDFVGSNSNENLYYVYNADSIDGDAQGNFGFGQNPPALGVRMLNDDLDHFMSLNSSFGVTGFPFTDVEYHHILDARWRDGVPQSIGGNGHNPGSTPFYRYAYDGDPVAGTGWTETSAGNIPGNRNGIGSAPYFSLQSGQRHSIELALCYAQNPGSDHLTNINNLIALSQVVQQFYDTVSVTTPVIASNYDCSDWVGQEEISVRNSMVNVYPNPTSGQVSFSSTSPITEVDLYNLTGQLVDSYRNSNQQNFQIELPSTLQNGIYLLQWKNRDGNYGTEKLSLSR